MTLRHDLIGVPSEAVRRDWTDRDTLLYAVAIGAGAEDPATELEYTTENSAGVQQRVIPSFGCIVAGSRSPRMLGDFDTAKLLHAEQSVIFHRALSPAGSASATATLTHIYDKQKAALLVQENVATDAETGAPLVTSVSSFMVFGEGGFGGNRGSATTEWAVPDRAPDAEVTFATRRDQPLLYRLTGDRNPLHSDPSVAPRAGQPRPIMHGMCVFGFTCRGLVRTAGGHDPDSLQQMSARFSKPALPGDDLRVQVWQDGRNVQFRTLNPAGDVLLDRGTAVLR
ncbi:MaoC/PaaZ C-terminal domain-containing protein [Rhodococcus koreensis]